MRKLRRFPVSIALLFWMTALTGLLYPLAVTGIAQLLFPRRANGSLLVLDGQVRGSELLAQKFESPAFFHARPSTSDYAYVGSGASNLGPTSAALAEQVKKRAAAWRTANGAMAGSAPPDMLYASASGLDPDISLEAALGQLPRVCAARRLDAGAAAGLERRLRTLAGKATGLIGPARINVVQLDALLETDPAFAAR